jgi:Sulfotransferase domain
MLMPDFLIIGAAKSGTTALYHYLKQHPEIYMSPTKETEFFAFEGETLNFCGPGDMPRRSITCLEDYQAQFQGVSTEKAIGEASPLYLYSAKASERICHYVPHAKLIAILRDPIERAYSQFLMFVRDGRETTLDFATALREEDSRIQNNWAWGWHYTQVGFYYPQLKRYFDTFNSEQIKVYLYEDLNRNSIAVLQEIFGFLGVDEMFLPDISVKHNISGMPKNKLLHDFFAKPNPVRLALRPLLPAELRKQMRVNVNNQNLSKPQLSPEIREQLIPVFREDILQLQDLIQRDLSAWLV